MQILWTWNCLNSYDYRSIFARVTSQWLCKSEFCRVARSLLMTTYSIILTLNFGHHILSFNYTPEVSFPFLWPAVSTPLLEIFRFSKHYQISGVIYQWSRLHKTKVWCFFRTSLVWKAKNPYNFNPIIRFDSLGVNTVWASPENVYSSQITTDLSLYNKELSRGIKYTSIAGTVRLSGCFIPECYGRLDGTKVPLELPYISNKQFTILNNILLFM